MRTVRNATTDRTGVFWDANAPGSRYRFPTKPVTGDRMIVFASVNPQLVLPGLRLRELRPREIDLRHRRLVPRIRVVEPLPRQELPVVQAARPLERGLGELEVGVALTHRRARHLERGLGLLDLLSNLPVFDDRNRLAVATRDRPA